MRFLPILLPIFMLAPIAIWIILEAVVLKGEMAQWLSGNLFEAIALGAVTVAVCVVFSWWVGENIVRTMGKGPRHHA
jgi:hypothetical protein